MNMKTRILLSGVLLVSLGIIIAWFAGSFEEKIAPAQITVTTGPHDGERLQVELTQEPVIEEATGTIRPKIESIISSRILANIIDIQVRSGDQVSAGDTLVILDARDIQARVDQVRQNFVAIKARLIEAEANFKRTAELYEKKTIAKADLDRAKATYDSLSAEFAGAKKAVDEAATGLSYTVIKAPINGRISDRFADPGDTAVPGSPLLRVYNPETLRLEAYVRESLAAKVHVGDELNVYIDAIDDEIPATVDEIVPSADPGSRSITIKVILENGSQLVPGMFGRLQIQSKTVKRIYIPANAVHHVGQLEYVYVVNRDNSLERRYIRSGYENAEKQVDILSGLSSGEIILVEKQ